MVSRALDKHRSGALVRAERVLLCAGAIDSPRLLMLSGPGPADELKAFGASSPGHERAVLFSRPFILR